MEKLLPDICRIQYGFAFDSAKFSDSVGTPLIRIRDVVRGYSETYTTEQCGDEYVVQDGDMLIGMDGEFNIAHWKGGKAYLNQRVCRLIPTDKINSLYLFYFMPQALKAIEDRTPFVTVKHLSAKELNKVSVPIPSMAEQEKIATSLQKVDELISLRKQQLAKLDELVKSRFIELFGDPLSNPNGWKTEKAETHIDLLSGFPFDSSQYTESGVNICGGLIIMPQRIEWNACKYWCSIEGYEEYTLKKNDIVIALDRPWISEGFKIAMVDAEHLPALLIQRTARIRANGINQFYLMYCFILGGFDKHCNVTGSLVPHISSKDIRSFSIMLPPLELQEQFAAFVEQTDKSKLSVQQSLNKLEILKKALMQKYFG